MARVPATRFRAALLVGAAACTLTAAARAADDSGIGSALALDPPEWMWGDLEFRLGGSAAGALYTAHEEAGPAYPGGFDETNVTGEAHANNRVQRTFDNGMVVGARSEFLLYHDELSGDIYDNDTVERLYAFAQTGFGRIEIGQQDGAGYQLALTGPQAVPAVSLEGGGLSLFRNPITGEEFAPFFMHVTAVQSSSNYAKINYISPRLFGAQIGMSFTPQIVRAPVPFAGNPIDDPNGQDDIFEIAASYQDYIGAVAVGGSAAYAHGSVRNRTPGFADLSDWALGWQMAYTLGEVKLSAGGAFRDSNAYLLEVTQALNHGGTRTVRATGTAEWGSWILGGEYTFADVKGPVNFGIAGYQAALGYKINDNLQVSGGWQWQNYRRSSGTFYNGNTTIDMNGGFLTFNYGL